MSNMRDQLDPQLKAAVDQIQEQLSKMKDFQAKKSKQVETRHQLGSQTHENELVRSELEHLEEGAQVYKLIGPTLVSQDPADARVIVSKRLEYISKETKRCEQLIADYDKQEDACRQVIMKLQQQVQARQEQLSESQSN